jgi:hypothetical protein
MGIISTDKLITLEWENRHEEDDDEDGLYYHMGECMHVRGGNYNQEFNGFDLLLISVGVGTAGRIEVSREWTYDISDSEICIG